MRRLLLCLIGGFILAGSILVINAADIELTVWTRMANGNPQLFKTARDGTRISLYVSGAMRKI
ncbi:MAG: hypothetical protein HYX80_05370 [Chloroflexi bacterium]|nr:hypothetical protein [Chloroflexota bacterium]